MAWVTLRTGRPPRTLRGRDLVLTGRLPAAEKRARPRDAPLFLL